MIGLPSTDWVGYDVAEHIDKKQYAHIAYFKRFDEQIEPGVIIMIKRMPSLSWIKEKKALNYKLIYIPVDKYSEEHKLIKDTVKLPLMDGICVHNDRLGKLLNKYNNNIFFIDHYLKYELKETFEYKPSGFILWVGHLEYLPSLIIKLKSVNLKHPVKILSDLEKLKYYREGLKKELALKKIIYEEQKVADGKYLICGLEVEQWSVEAQESALVECKAAFDTKSNSFAHNLKPPTKSQKYIFNNIPFAMDKFSYSSQYFKDRGLTIPSVDDERWLSEEYYNDIKDFVKKFRKTVDLDYVSKSYIDIAEKVTVLPSDKTNTIKSYHYILDNIYFLMSVANKALSRIKSILARMIIKLKNN